MLVTALPRLMLDPAPPSLPTTEHRPSLHVQLWTFLYLCPDQAPSYLADSILIWTPDCWIILAMNFEMRFSVQNGKINSDTYLTFQDLCDLLVLQIHGQLQVSKDTVNRRMCEICVIYLGSRGFLHMSVGWRRCNTSGRPYTI
jgi:hypothetical protein